MIAHTNTAISPLPCGRQHGHAVGGEGDAERVQRLLVVGDAAVRRRCAASATRREQAHRDPEDEPERHVLEHEAATTRSPSSPPAPRVKASTAGSARPSFMPDSRLSEWRTTRGTRGLVTTDDESTGSVGESSAPSRKDSVQPRSVSRASPRRRSRRSAASPARACAAAGATPAAASRPRPRARRGTGSRSARRAPGRATKPERGSKCSTPARRRRAGSRRARTPRSARGTNGGRARRRARRSPAGRRG